jgi:hypothetical protein
MHCPSLLLFDLGGVLIESTVFERLNGCLPEPLERQAIKERWLMSPSVRRFESGETEPLEFAEHFIAEWGLNLTPQAFERIYILASSLFSRSTRTTPGITHHLPGRLPEQFESLAWGEIQGHRGRFRYGPDVAFIGRRQAGPRDIHAGTSPV